MHSETEGVSTRESERERDRGRDGNRVRGKRATTTAHKHRFDQTCVQSEGRKLIQIDPARPEPSNSLVESTQRNSILREKLAELDARLDAYADL